MGKKNKSGATNLGKSLIRDRFNNNKNSRKFVDNNSMLHTTEVQDGYDWGRLNLQSVTEESSFQEFLSTAELAGTEFQGEKLNITFVNPRTNVGLLSADETNKMKIEQEQNKHLIKIPRRPPWNSKTTAEELDRLEREHFLEWRRQLASLQENNGVLLTPYEKNLEFWRQLWRVVERSDVIVQIVDARNPLLFRCEDLENYVTTVSPHKINLTLLNKADYLTQTQRAYWCDYFDQIGVRIAFFSALQSTDTNELDENDKMESHSDKFKEISQQINALGEAVESTAGKLTEIQRNIDKKLEELSLKSMKNSPDLLTKDELIQLFQTIHTGQKVTSGITTIGLVGYPNVGKSSTINCLLTAKKVSVSATPGKTKHFQTLYLTNDLLLCDCPGLVMPSFVYSKAEMITNGILPIDQMRDHVPPVNLVANLIPKHVLEDRYGIMLPVPDEQEDPNRPPTSEELLNAYGYIRGFMTANGQPDNPRGARYILKDFINGKLLYCHAPPDIEQSIYHAYPEKVRTSRPLPPREQRAIKPNHVTVADLDRAFFKTHSKGVHMKGVAGKIIGIPTNPNPDTNTTEGGTGKPWKKFNKHVNKNKKEKLRRVYAHLDQH